MTPRDPEELEAAGAPARADIAPDTTVGPVHLSVSNLDHSLNYYVESIGLRALDHGSGRATLGTAAGDALLVLVEEPDARPAPGHTGLYHFALLVPRRFDLAQWLVHAARARLPLTGVADHFVSEALYLTDPDGHGIEIYWDRPRETWEGQVAARMTTLPLDIDDLVGELDGPESEHFDGLASGTTMGHVHLKVADVAETVAFYRDVLGFALMAQLGSQAAFLSAGGYHHHFGANTWESRGALPAPAGTAALRHATIVFVTDADRDEVLARIENSGHDVVEDAEGAMVRDPSGNALALTKRQ